MDQKKITLEGVPFLAYLHERKNGVLDNGTPWANVQVTPIDEKGVPSPSQKFTYEDGLQETIETAVVSSVPVKVSFIGKNVKQGKSGHTVKLSITKIEKQPK